jgi:hypothetical protein
MSHYDRAESLEMVVDDLEDALRRIAERTDDGVIKALVADALARRPLKWPPPAEDEKEAQ